MRRVLAAVGVVGAVLFGNVAPAAAHTGDQTFVIFGEGDAPASLYAVGPVSGSGLDFEDEETESSLFQFEDGSFVVNHPADSDNFRFNPVTCVGSDRFTGTYTLTAGTGAYAGISGSGTYRGWAIFVAERLPDGSCSEDAVTNTFFVRATGTTTLP